MCHNLHVISNLLNRFYIYVNSAVYNRAPFYCIFYTIHIFRIDIMEGMLYKLKMFNKRHQMLLIHVIRISHCYAVF